MQLQDQKIGAVGIPYFMPSPPSEMLAMNAILKRSNPRADPPQFGQIASCPTKGYACEPSRPVRIWLQIECCKQHGEPAIWVPAHEIVKIDLLPIHPCCTIVAAAVSSSAAENLDLYLPVQVGVFICKLPFRQNPVGQLVRCRPPCGAAGLKSHGLINL